MNIHPAKSRVISDGQTDRHDKSNSRYLQFLVKRLKTETLIMYCIFKLMHGRYFVNHQRL